MLHHREGIHVARDDARAPLKIDELWSSSSMRHPPIEVEAPERLSSGPSEERAVPARLILAGNVADTLGSLSD